MRFLLHPCDIHYFSWCRYIRSNHIIVKRSMQLFCSYIIEKSPVIHKMEHNGGFSNFETLIPIKNTRDVVQLSESLSYEIYSIFLPKLATFVLFILVLSISVIILQATDCCAVTTGKPGGALQLHLYGGVWPQDWKMDPSAD